MFLRVNETRWTPRVLAGLVLATTAACREAGAPPPPPPAARATPTPPPQTSLGRLVRVETSPKVKVRVQYLTLSGLKSGVDDKEAGKGKTFVVLHFEGRPPAAKPAADKAGTGLVALSSGGSGGRLQASDNSATGEPDLWLTDSTGAKYADWSSFWEKEDGSIAFEVPEGVSGLVFHDGAARRYSISPTPAPSPPPAASPAK